MDISVIIKKPLCFQCRWFLLKESDYKKCSLCNDLDLQLKLSSYPLWGSERVCFSQDSLVLSELSQLCSKAVSVPRHLERDTQETQRRNEGLTNHQTAEFPLLCRSAHLSELAGQPLTLLLYGYQVPRLRGRRGRTRQREATLYGRRQGALDLLLQEGWGREDGKKKINCVDENRGVRQSHGAVYDTEWVIRVLTERLLEFFTTPDLPHKFPLKSVHIGI